MRNGKDSLKIVYSKELNEKEEVVVVAEEDSSKHGNILTKRGINRVPETFLDSGGGGAVQFSEAIVNGRPSIVWSSASGIAAVEDSSVRIVKNGDDVLVCDAGWGTPYGIVHFKTVLWPAFPKKPPPKKLFSIPVGNEGLCVFPENGRIRVLRAPTVKEGSKTVPGVPEVILLSDGSTIVSTPYIEAPFVIDEKKRTRDLKYGTHSPPSSYLRFRRVAVYGLEWRSVAAPVRQIMILSERLMILRGEDETFVTAEKTGDGKWEARETIPLKGFDKRTREKLSNYAIDEISDAGCGRYLLRYISPGEDIHEKLDYAIYDSAEAKIKRIPPSERDRFVVSPSDNGKKILVDLEGEGRKYGSVAPSRSEKIIVPMENRYGKMVKLSNGRPLERARKDERSKSIPERKIFVSKENALFTFPENEKVSGVKGKPLAIIKGEANSEYFVFHERGMTATDSYGKNEATFETNMDGEITVWMKDVKTEESVEPKEGRFLKEIGRASLVTVYKEKGFSALYLSPLNTGRESRLIVLPAEWEAKRAVFFGKERRFCMVECAERMQEHGSHPFAPVKKIAVVFDIQGETKTLGIRDAVSVTPPVRDHDAFPFSYSYFVNEETEMPEDIDFFSLDVERGKIRHEKISGSKIEEELKRVEDMDGLSYRKTMATFHVSTGGETFIVAGIAALNDKMGRAVVYSPSKGAFSIEGPLIENVYKDGYFIDVRIVSALTEKKATEIEKKIREISKKIDMGGRGGNF